MSTPAEPTGPGRSAPTPAAGDWPLLTPGADAPGTDAPDPAPRSTSTAPGGLRASDGDRAQVATVLSTAYAEGRLTHEEHEERLDQAMRARTFDELVPLTGDLVPLDRPLTRTARPAAGPRIETSTGADTTDRFIAVFGGFERKGRWRARRDNQMLVLFGGGALDLTEAIWESDRIELVGLTAFGGVEVTVPEGVDVRNETVAVLGGADTDVPAAAEGAPVLVLKGFCMFGGVSVKVARPGDDDRAGPRTSGHGSGRHGGCGHH